MLALDYRFDSALYYYINTFFFCFSFFFCTLPLVFTDHLNPVAYNCVVCSCMRTIRCHWEDVNNIVCLTPIRKLFCLFKKLKETWNKNKLCILFNDWINQLNSFRILIFFYRLPCKVKRKQKIATQLFDINHFSNLSIKNIGSWREIQICYDFSDWEEGKEMIDG